MLTVPGRPVLVTWSQGLGHSMAGGATCGRCWKNLEDFLVTYGRPSSKVHEFGIWDVAYLSSLALGLQYLDTAQNDTVTPKVQKGELLPVRCFDTVWSCTHILWSGWSKLDHWYGDRPKPIIILYHILEGWTSIHQLFRCWPGDSIGFDPWPHSWFSPEFNKSGLETTQTPGWSRHWSSVSWLQQRKFNILDNCG